MLYNCGIEEKRLLLLCNWKLLRRVAIAWKFLHFFVRDTNWVRGVSRNRLRDQRSTGTMAKMSADLQYVVERLLWIVAVCLISFEAVPGLLMCQHARRLVVGATSNPFDMSSVTSTGWSPSTHIQSSATFTVGVKFLLIVEKHVAAILARRQPTGLRLPVAYWGLGVQCSSPKHYRHQNIRIPGMDGHEQRLRYQKLQCFQTPEGIIASDGCYIE